LDKKTVGNYKITTRGFHFNSKSFKTGKDRREAKMDEYHNKKEYSATTQCVYKNDSEAKDDYDKADKKVKEYFTKLKEEKCKNDSTKNPSARKISSLYISN
jgi:hypothetical protein